MYYLNLLIGPMGELVTYVNECPFVMSEALLHAKKLEQNNTNITITDWGFNLLGPYDQLNK